MGSKVIQVARKIWQELPAFQENGRKTRLRGKDVGGPHESEEPLARCISCRGPTCFEQAVSFAEGQLKKIHQEYREMCREKNYPEPESKDVRAISDHPHAGTLPNREVFKDSEDYFDGSYLDGQKNDAQQPNRGRRPGGAPTENEIDGLIEDRYEARKAANCERADGIRIVTSSNVV